MHYYSGGLWPVYQWSSLLLGHYSFAHLVWTLEIGITVGKELACPISIPIISMTFPGDSCRTSRHCLFLGYVRRLYLFYHSFPKRSVVSTQWHMPMWFQAVQHSTSAQHIKQTLGNPVPRTYSTSDIPLCSTPNPLKSCCIRAWHGQRDIIYECVKTISPGYKPD